MDCRVELMAETALDNDEHVPSASDAEQVVFGAADLHRVLQDCDCTLDVDLATVERWPDLLDARPQLQPTITQSAAASYDVVEQGDGTQRLPEVLERDARKAFQLEAPRFKLRKQCSSAQEEGNGAVVVTTPHRPLTGSS